MASWNSVGSSGNDGSASRQTADTAAREGGRRLAQEGLRKAAHGAADAVAPGSGQAAEVGADATSKGVGAATKPQEAPGAPDGSTQGIGPSPDGNTSQDGSQGQDAVDASHGVGTGEDGRADGSAGIDSPGADDGGNAPDDKGPAQDNSSSSRTNRRETTSNRRDGSSSSSKKGNAKDDKPVVSPDEGGPAKGEDAFSPKRPKSPLGHIGKAVSGFVTSTATTITTVIGITTAAATAVAVTATVGLFAMVLAFFVGVGALVLGSTSTSSDGTVSRCQASMASAESKQADDGTDTTDVSATELAYAKKIYSAYTTMYGTSDSTKMAIAGLLGNFSIESGIDPTTVETIYSEPYDASGTLHQEAAAADYDPSCIISNYGSRFPLIKKLGLGLGQWTDTNDGSTEHTQLMDFATKMGGNWYDLDIQLAFAVAGSDNGGAGNDLAPYLDGSRATYSTPDEAAEDIMHHWEGNSNSTLSAREGAAESWYAQMADWAVDATYGNSILSMVNSAGSTATAANISSAKLACGVITSASDVGCGSIADAYLSFAWPTRAASYNLGTALYKAVFAAVGQSGNSRDCGKSVGTAVRWSGADSTYPISYTPTQTAYLETSPKWTEVTAAVKAQGEAALQPGDVIIMGTPSGHTFLYIGHENCLKKYTAEEMGNENTNTGEASYPTRSAELTAYTYTSSDWYWSGDFKVFRCTTPDHDTTYSSMTFTQSGTSE